MRLGAASHSTYVQGLLDQFIVRNRNELLARARSKVAARHHPPASEAELTHGLPVFLDQLRDALQRAASKQPADHVELAKSASQHGDDLFRRGMTVGQVVHDYGDLCQVITLLAMEQQAPLVAKDFQMLNLCLDDAIAGAVTEWASQREIAIAAEGTERLGVLAHEMRNLLNTALMSFESIKAGVVAPGGSTSLMLERSLLGLVALIDRSLAEVRLDSGMQNLESFPLWEMISEVEIAASIMAKKRGLSLSVTSVDRSVLVRADRQILTATVSNLMQNALKFTQRGTRISLRARTTASGVTIEVEDECGGLPPGQEANLLRPFEQQGTDRSGLGLGLSICLKAVKAIGGELKVRDLPRKGCVFTIDLPEEPPPLLEAA